MNNIGWCTKTWNPVSGCSPTSEGCEHCWAKRMSKRLAGRFGYPEDNPFAVTLHTDKLDEPLHWGKPQRVFVVSMGDLFHELVPIHFFSDIMDRVIACPQHTFIMLTKRPQHMNQLLGEAAPLWKGALPYEYGIPHKNLWLMTTCENQRRADERIPILLETPATMRGVSLEPMLGPINLHLRPPNCSCGSRTWNTGGNLGAHCRRCNRDLPFNRNLRWVILGAETGPGARHMELDWARRVRDDCQKAGVAFWFKKDSAGSHELDGQIWEQLPEIST